MAIRSQEHQEHFMFGNFFRIVGVSLGKFGGPSSQGPMWAKSLNFFPFGRVYVLAFVLLVIFYGLGSHEIHHHFSPPCGRIVFFSFSKHLTQIWVNSCLNWMIFWIFANGKWLEITISIHLKLYIFLLMTHHQSKINHSWIGEYPQNRPMDPSISIGGVLLQLIETTRGSTRRGNAVCWLRVLWCPDIFPEICCKYLTPRHPVISPNASYIFGGGSKSRSSAGVFRV